MSQISKIFFLILTFSFQLSFAGKGKYPTPDSLNLKSEQELARTELLYYGGPIMSQVKLVSVFWGDRTNSKLRQEMPFFYQDFVNSYQMSWLNEYHTKRKSVDGKEGTGQNFQRGQYLGQKILKPMERSKNLNDAKIGAELVAQIKASQLPVPDQNTLYMIHFPADVTISTDADVSCQQFLGYHYFFKTKEYGTLFFAVLPECPKQNLTATSLLNDITVVSSHELMEAVTDPFPTPGDRPAFPQAWNTRDGEEISDICNGRNTRFTGASKHSYMVTTNWSNAHRECYEGK